MGFASGFAAGLAVGKKKWGGVPSDDWRPPADWISVPEPKPYDIYILVWATKNNQWNTGMNFELMLGRESDNGIGYGNISCDFGDGDVHSGNGYPRHTYTEEGQYLIRITTDDNTNCWRSGGQNQAAWQIVKTGDKISFVTDYNENGSYPYANVFPNKNHLKHVQINHPKGLPMNENVSLFQSCYALRKIDLKKKISGDILKYTFQNCRGLSDVSKVLNGDEISSIKDYAFQDCCNLKSVYAPNCMFVGNKAFENCYNLQEIVVAEDCTFGTNCFPNCYSLYPRPDGSIN